MSFSGQINGVCFSYKIDQEKLNEIFGFPPKVNLSSQIGNMSFDKGKMVVITGAFVEIIGKNNAYKISTSEFSKTINSSEIKGNGYFEGPSDEIGKKLINLFFSNYDEGSFIYINDEKRQLLKKENSIELV